MQRYLARARISTRLFPAVVATVLLAPLALQAGESATPGGGGKVVATVDGKPIFENQVNAGLPRHAFGAVIVHARKVRLDRLIYIALLDGFLKEKAVVFGPEEVKAEIVAMRKIPPAAGCSCCRFESLGQFMKVNYFTMPDLMELTRVNKGLEKYVSKLWDEEYPTADKVNALLEEKREELKKGYIHVSHIFFNSYQDPEYYKDKKGVTAKKMARAVQAWGRLGKGESFSSVAAEVSEDKVSRIEGGAMGCIPENQFGPDFRDASRKLGIGEYSKPVHSPWGIHIILREDMTDDDLRGLLEKQFMEGMGRKIIREVKDASKIVKTD